jgi:hypothetical protein
MNAALTGLLAELDQRSEIAKSHLGVAGGDALDRLQIAVGRFDGDVEAFGLEITLGDRDQEGCRRPFQFAIKREPDRGLCDGGAAQWHRGEHSRKHETDTPERTHDAIHWIKIAAEKNMSCERASKTVSRMAAAAFSGADRLQASVTDSQGPEDIRWPYPPSQTA